MPVILLKVKSINRLRSTCLTIFTHSDLSADPFYGLYRTYDYDAMYFSLKLEKSYIMRFKVMAKGFDVVLFDQTVYMVKMRNVIYLVLLIILKQAIPFFDLVLEKSILIGVTSIT